MMQQDHFDQGGADVLIPPEFVRVTRKLLYRHLDDGGEWLVEALPINKTLEDCIAASAEWALRAGKETGLVAGCPFVSWRAVQPHKNAQRRALTIVDFGKTRMLLRVYLPDIL